jgi:hypothetical protein
LIVLDGHNNPGFSGGPVVFSPLKGDTHFRVAGVISGFEAVKNQIHGPSGESPLYSWDNTGLIKAYSIQRAIELIHANPIGFPCNY